MILTIILVGALIGTVAWVCTLKNSNDNLQKKLKDNVYSNLDDGK